MTNKTYMTYMSNSKIIPPHGGYRNLKSYQMAEIVYDLTAIFVKKYIPAGSRTRDQMVQAARSGKQNIAEASMGSGTSKKMELKLIGVARASQEELLQDYEDFLRQQGLALWDKNSQPARDVRALAYRSNRSYKTYVTYMTEPEAAANCLICLINQTNFLLDRQILVLENEFQTKGGFTERLYHSRSAYRSDKSYKSYYEKN